MLPVSAVVALVLSFLFIRYAIRARTSIVFLALVAACAAQSLIVALAQFYDVGAAKRLQPITAAFVPALAYLAFQSIARRDIAAWPDALHIAGPVATAALLMLAPSALDAFLVLLFASYGALILFELRRGADDLTRARLEASDTSVLVWRAIAITLIASAMGDAMIAVAKPQSPDDVAAWIVATMSSVLLLAIGLLSLSSTFEMPQAAAVRTDEYAAQKAGADEAGPTATDAAILASLEELMVRDQIFRDPDLTLRQLARRLGQPAKAVSQAVNRSRGENVSRYINAHRIAFACTELQTGASVTDAMLASGFNTKSNFNREFLRLRGVSPTAWLAKGHPR